MKKESIVNFDNEKYKNLTPAQKDILVRMTKENLILCCTEGSDYKVWLADSKGKKLRPVRKDTASAIVNAGCLDRLVTNNPITEFVVTDKLKSKIR